MLGLNQLSKEHKFSCSNTLFLNKNHSIHIESIFDSMIESISESSTCTTTSATSSSVSQTDFFTNVCLILNPTALNGFQKMMNRRKDIRLHLQKFLNLFKGSSTASSSSKSRSTTSCEHEALQKSAEELGRWFPDPSKIRDALMSFDKSNHADFLDMLYGLICEEDGFLDLKSIKDVIKTCDLIPDKIPHRLLLGVLIRRCIPIYSRADHLLSLFHAMKESFDNNLVNFKMIFQIYASSFPALFSRGDVAEEALYLLDSDLQSGVDLGLEILSLVGDYIIAQMKAKDKTALSKRLCKIVITSCTGRSGITAKNKSSKWAIRALSRAFPHYTSGIKNLCEALVKKCKYDKISGDLPTILDCLGELALRFSSIFTPFHDQVTSFVVKEVLMKLHEEDQHTTTTKTKTRTLTEEDEWREDVSFEICAKISGIKLLVKQIEGLSDNLPHYSKPVYKLLTAILHHGGNVVAVGRSRRRSGDGGTESNESNHHAWDKSRLRLAAACSLAKLDGIFFQKSQYTAMMLTPVDFHKLALVAQDACYEVRRLFVRKISKLLGRLALPVQYMCVLSLAAVDPEADNVRQAKILLENAISTRRNILRTNANAQRRRYVLLPEYAVPPLISLLAHHPDFSEREEDLHEFERYLNFFLDGILHHADHYSFLNNLVETIKQYEDRLVDGSSGGSSRPMYVICDLALLLINRRAHNRQWVLKPFPGEIIASASLFVVPSKPIRNQTSYLPKGFGDFQRPYATTGTTSSTTAATSSSVVKSEMKSENINTGDSTSMIETTSGGSGRTGGGVRHKRRSPPSSTSGGSSDCQKRKKNHMKSDTCVTRVRESRGRRVKDKIMSYSEEGPEEDDDVYASDGSSRSSSSAAGGINNGENVDPNVDLIGSRGGGLSDKTMSGADEGVADGVEAKRRERDVSVTTRRSARLRT